MGLKGPEVYRNNPTKYLFQSEFLIHVMFKIIKYLGLTDLLFQSMELKNLHFFKYYMVNVSTNRVYLIMDRSESILSQF